MSGCTAPIRGHRTASAEAECPVCGKRNSYYSSYSPNYNSSSSSHLSVSSGSSNGTSSKDRKKPSWSKSTSLVSYTPAQIKILTPVRENVEQRASTNSNLRDIFLCHAWDDRNGAAKELNNLLETNGVSVWFSEKDVPLGSNLLREIDKGLVKSKIGIVLVTPKFLERVKAEGIADKELSALLFRDLLVPIVHNTTYEELRDVSPLLGSRSGLNTKEETMEEIAKKLAELVST